MGRGVILELKNLHTEVEQKEILKGVNLQLKRGRIYALMGPNGAGKSSLAYTIMGHPRFKVSRGEIIFNGENITNLTPSERAQRGIFLAFQYPIEISGITLFNFLRLIFNTRVDDRKSPMEFSKFLKSKLEVLDLNEKFISRYLNEGLSGGEKKKSEVLQMVIVNPELVILDEIDSGLDIDAMKIVSNTINNFFNEDKTILIITHYQRFLDYVKPDNIFVMFDGKILASGGYELIDLIEREGYETLEKRREHDEI
ncbi:MAG: Fe-S cluster assembly ATPase SufC [bacterium]|nr:Fe-S cluster assembly ATPase SufC [bacterium]